MSIDHVRVGLVGGGGIATAHLAGWAAVADQATVTAVADADPATAAARAVEVGGAAFADFADLVREAPVDAVDVCLPHHLHRDAVVLAAEAGKHVLCEKPLCLTVDEARDVRAAVRANGVTLMCAHNQLFLPAVAAARRLLDEGAIGRVYEVRTTDSFRNDFDPTSMGWRASAATSGGGELIDTGYHPSYLLLHLAGGAPVEVTAMLSRHRLDFMEGEDSAQVLVRFSGGVVGSLVTSWAYDPPSGTEKFSAVGELGALRSDGVRLVVERRGQEPEVVELEPVDTVVAEIAHFVGCLRTGTRPLHTEDEGIAVLGMILAAYESARSGTVAPVVAV